MGYAAKTALPSCAVVKGYRRASTTNGQKTSWKRVRRGLLATQHEQPIPMRSRHFAARQRISRRSSQSRHSNCVFSRKACSGMGAGMPHQRSWRSFGWWKKATCQRVGHWPSWAFPAPHFTAGTTGICSVVRLVCRIDLPSPITFGTAFRSK